jgi:ABC-type nitrate/sulfonate/bicarbonate transport system permease component
MGAPRRTIISRVIVPAAMPAIFSGLRIALPIAIIVIVLTEMIGDSRGLGYYIAISGTRFEFPSVYAAILVIGACGFVLDRGLLRLLRAVVHWEHDAEATR